MSLAAGRLTMITKLFTLFYKCLDADGRELNPEECARELGKAPRLDPVEKALYACLKKVLELRQNTNIKIIAGEAPKLVIETERDSAVIDLRDLTISESGGGRAAEIAREILRDITSSQ